MFPQWKNTLSNLSCYKYHNTSSNPIFLIPTCFKRTHNAKIILRQLTFTQDKNTHSQLTTCHKYTSPRRDNVLNPHRLPICYHYDRHQNFFLRTVRLCFWRLARSETLILNVHKGQIIPKRSKVPTPPPLPPRLCPRQQSPSLHPICVDGIIDTHIMTLRRRGYDQTARTLWHHYLTIILRSSRTELRCVSAWAKRYHVFLLCAVPRHFEVTVIETQIMTSQQLGLLPHFIVAMSSLS